MRTISRSSVESHLKVTKLYRFNQDNPMLSARASCRTGCTENCPGFIETLQLWTHWTITSGLPCLGCHAGAQNDWWVESRPVDHLRRATTRTHQQGGGELHQALDCLHGCGCQWWSVRASAVTLFYSSTSPQTHLITIKLILFTATNRLLVKTTFGTLRDGIVLVEIAQSCHFQIHFNITWW